VAALRAEARPGFDLAVGGRARREDEAAEREYLVRRLRRAAR
jgi:hypothetical protein